MQVKEQAIKLFQETFNLSLEKSGDIRDYLLYSCFSFNQAIKLDLSVNGRSKEFWIAVEKWCKVWIEKKSKENKDAIATNEDKENTVREEVKKDKSEDVENNVNVVDEIISFYLKASGGGYDRDQILTKHNLSKKDNFSWDKITDIFNKYHEKILVAQNGIKVNFFKKLRKDELKKYILDNTNTTPNVNVFDYAIAANNSVENEDKDTNKELNIDNSLDKDVEFLEIKDVAKGLGYVLAVNDGNYFTSSKCPYLIYKQGEEEFNLISIYDLEQAKDFCYKKSQSYTITIFTQDNSQVKININPDSELKAENQILLQIIQRVKPSVISATIKDWIETNFTQSLNNVDEINKELNSILEMIRKFNEEELKQYRELSYQVFKKLGDNDKVKTLSQYFPDLKKDTLNLNPGLRIGNLTFTFFNEITGMYEFITPNGELILKNKLEVIKLRIQK